MNKHPKLTQDEIQQLAYKGFMAKYNRIPTSSEGIQIMRQINSGPQKFVTWMMAGRKMEMLIILLLLLSVFWGVWE